MNYYNEFDPFAAAWLRNLISAGLIAPGDVDERSISDVKPDDLRGYTQCHFFAGIGGWSYALRLAGWPDDKPVWTGSCPCQPFSSAGNQKGKADERHLWPVWYGLIRECRPATVFGEQVASAVAHGWLDDVYQGLEAEGYACGAAVLPACSVGAPHKRDRLWFVANAASERGSGASGAGGETVGRSEARDSLQFGRAGDECGDVAHTPINGRGQSNTNTRWGRARICKEQGALSGDNCESNVADTLNQGSQRHGRPINQPIQERREGAQRYPWTSGVWIDCPDGKQRLIEPGVPLLANGVRNRVGKLRGYGNAIVPQVAAEFIKGYMNIDSELYAEVNDENHNNRT